MAANDLPSCPYCGSTTIIQDSKVIYGKSYGDVLTCVTYPHCDSYVSVRRGKPIGTLANAVLRELRTRCHKEFDKWWKGPEATMSRTAAYHHLAVLVDPEGADPVHIGHMETDACNQLLVLLGEHDLETTV